MWKEYIQSLDAGCKFQPPATEEQIAEVEAYLSVPLPEELRQLLLESNGVESENGDSIVFSTKGIFGTNEEMRNDKEFAELFMPFDNLLFFADDIGGNFFGYGITKCGIVTDMIFCWDHDSDNRLSVHWKLKPYLKWYLEGFPELP